jgi:hypothetical protein
MLGGVGEWWVECVRSVEGFVGVVWLRVLVDGDGKQQHIH